MHRERVRLSGFAWAGSAEVRCVSTRSENGGGRTSRVADDEGREQERRGAGRPPDGRTQFKNNFIVDLRGAPQRRAARRNRGAIEGRRRRRRNYSPPAIILKCYLHHDR